MLKIGIIGCGRIADRHASEIEKIAGCEIIGACDREILMAQQLYDRFNIQHYFSDVNQLLELKPDIVHITTPPQSHLELGKICINAGCHLFIEKPFTLNSTEAIELIEHAQKNNLKLTVGHNAQFSHAARRLRALIESGYLGGDPVHIESIWCYNHNDPSYAKPLLRDKKHWIRSLPGNLLHDVISHGISKIVEFIKSDSPQVLVHGFTSHFLKTMDENNFIDELRVIIHDHDKTTAYFTFSSQIYPIVKQFRVYGPKNSLIMDHEHQTVIDVTKNYKYYLNHFIPPLIDAKQFLSNSAHNMIKFIKKDFHFEAGRKYLIETFYQSVSEDKPLPIAYREILLTSKIMDNIFRQLKFDNKEIMR
jgi:predicted dehydrogenase